jgi:D-beta-D-heptose 7-phosphate kinase/D-beta-D-heptose 1-phosphate adenosyltransferase
LEPNLSSFQKCRVLVIGDFMLDAYLWGNVDRISPEAPVPVVSFIKESFTLGGAGNVVNNLLSLGATVLPAGVVGTDPNGNRLLEHLAELGIETSGIIAENGRPTTRKTRVIAAHQQVLRIDREITSAVSTETLDQLTAFIQKRVAQVDLVLVSDYNKGVVQPSLISELEQVARQHHKMTIADPKGNDFSKYRGMTILTPNQKEAAIASGMEITDETSLMKAGAVICQTASLQALLITRGKDGMVLLQKDRPPFHIHSEARQVFDVSGAGDTVLAVFGLAISSGASPETAASMANTAAGIVVGKLGTATVTRQEIAAALKNKQTT